MKGNIKLIRNSSLIPYSCIHDHAAIEIQGAYTLSPIAYVETVSEVLVVTRTSICPPISIEELLKFFCHSSHTFSAFLQAPPRPSGAPALRTCFGCGIDGLMFEFVSGMESHKDVY
jgi:hypothetical protein